MKNLSLSSRLPLVRKAGDGTLEPILTAVQRYMAMALSPNTLRAYRADWAHFEAWCREKRLRSFPADSTTVGLYVAGLASTSKVSTIERRLAAISKQHRAAGRYSPCSIRYSAICEVLKGIRREKGTRPNAKAALTTEELRTMILTLPQNPRGVRDAALLLIGFASGCRRSELVALNVDDIEDIADGLKLLLRKSKTDQAGEGRTIGIPYGSDSQTCPVRAYRRWIALSGITEGPVFRHFRGRHVGSQTITPQVVAKTVKCAAKHAGLDPARLAGILCALVWRRRLRGMVPLSGPSCGRLGTAVLAWCDITFTKQSCFVTTLQPGLGYKT